MTQASSDEKVGCGTAISLFSATNSCSSLDRWGMNLEAVWHMSSLPFKTLWTYQNKIPNMSATPHRPNNHALFEDKFLHSTHIFICFTCWQMHQAFGNFNRGHTASEIWKPVRSLCPSLQKPFSTYQNLPWLCLPSLKQNCIWTRCSFKSAIF